MELTLKGVEKLNKKIDDFFAELGFEEVTSFLHTEFAYYSDSEEVSYTIFDDELADKGYLEYIKSRYDEIPKCLMFTFSLLHELGHHITLPKIKRHNILKLRKAKKILERHIVRYAKTPEQIVAYQVKYCKFLDERKATETAVKILLTNYDIVQKYDKIFAKALDNFYKKNNLYNLKNA